MSRVEREDLYNQIWEQPMTTVAKDYGVSSNYLARICQELKVPRPNRGYWAKRAAGKKVARVPLPPLDPGDDTIWERGPNYYNRGELPVPVYEREPQVRRRKKRPKVHPLVVDVELAFLDSKEKRYQDDGYLKPRRGDLPDLFVSKDALSATLRLASRLYLQLEDRGHWVRRAAKGHRVSMSSLRCSGIRRKDSHHEDRSWRPNRPTLVFIGGVAIGLTIFEIIESMPAIYRDSNFRPATPREVRDDELQPYRRIIKRDFPSGRLGLFAYSPYHRSDWQKYWLHDKGGTRLDNQLDAIIAELEQAAPHIAELEAQGKAEADERHRQYEEADRKRRAEAVVAAKKKAITTSRDQLLSVIETWATARHIEQFLTSLAEDVGMAPTQTKDELHARLEVARSLIDGTGALELFGQWRTPAELYEEPARWG